jgi:hypothetical protein
VNGIAEQRVPVVELFPPGQFSHGVIILEQGDESI